MQAVCRLYNVDVTDFSTSFADGRVLCLLVRSLTRESCLEMRACARKRLRHQQRQDQALLTWRQYYLQVNYYAPAKLSVSDIYAPGGYPDADAAALSAHEGGSDPSDAGSQRGEARLPRNRHHQPARR